LEYNRIHGITPRTVSKPVRDVIEATKVAEQQGVYDFRPKELPVQKLKRLAAEYEKRMREAARGLEFEVAAQLRDILLELRAELAIREGATKRSQKAEARSRKVGTGK
jgi:excinuclease ABC subunit B